MLFVAVFVFVYYTTWALLLVSIFSLLSLLKCPNRKPFVDEASALRDYFPPREWAVRGPALLLLVGIAGIAAFFAKVSAAEARKRKNSGKSA